jgi:hypothetical protein
VLLYYTLLSILLSLLLSISIPHDSVKGIDQSIYIKRSNTSKRLKESSSSFNQLPTSSILPSSIKGIHLSIS